MNGSRQSGRTSTVVAHARLLNDQGVETLIVAANQRQKMQLQREIGAGCKRVAHTTICAVTAEVLTTGLIPGCPNTVLLVDHYAWETRFQQLFKDLVEQTSKAAESTFTIARLKRAAFAFIREPHSPRAKLELEKLLGA